jgi:hypothetical protein
VKHRQQHRGGNRPRRDRHDVSLRPKYVLYTKMAGAWFTLD